MSKFVAEKEPLVSIGMPVFNGDRYLRQALDSLLDQTYGNFEIIISDNASTDATGAICQEVVERDLRVRYYRAEKNMGAVWNFNHVFDLARGEYFMWAAFDDLRAPQYLQRCVEVLEAQPNAVMCCTDIQIIDEEGCAVDNATVLAYSIRPVGATVRARVDALTHARLWLDIYGLIRSRVLSQTRRVLPVWGGDVVLTMELCLRGEVALVPEKLFSYRFFADKTEEDSSANTTSETETRPNKANWSQFSLEMARSVWLAPLDLSKRLKLLQVVIRDFYLGNSLARRGIRKEGFINIREAFNSKGYILFIQLTLITLLVYLADALSPLRHNRLTDSAMYRGGRLWGTLFRGG